MMLSSIQNWSLLKGIILLQMQPLLTMSSTLRFAVELHMVHYTEDGNITAAAILYQNGKPDPFLFQIKDKLAELYAEGYKGRERRSSACWSGGHDGTEVRETTKNRLLI
ncbi:uncharacterized protein LOC133919033 [Phragmites australis]|uniref:uncharacterized protein LOC133919033 n=1 Tax=Phragmites australis TaxID=29695 RepID=UPI002D769D66|nr:uncharacterized protein LOC133919033 [Phragmites australis]